MHPTGANEVRELVRRLGSTSRARVDAARARLTIIGARAVEELIRGVEGTNTRVRARAMPLLATIQDVRGREPLIAMLLDRNARLRRIAARCLARFPSADAVASLERAIARDAAVEVRVAAAQSLCEHCIAGEERAIRRLLPLLLDDDAPSKLRLASFGLLRALRPAPRRGLLRRLAEDGDAAVATQASQLIRESAKAGGDPSSERIERWLERLACDDYATWNESLRLLSGAGPGAVEPLVRAMCGRAHDPEFCTRAGMALKALGPRRCRSLADRLDEIDDPLPLQVLVEVIGTLGDKAQIYRLKDLIDRLAPPTGQEEPPADTGFDPLGRVRAKAHLELARIGSRVAIQDLQRELTSADRRIELELLAAVRLIGKREEIPVLLRAWGREDGYARERIAGAVREIMKRERIRRDDRALAGMGAATRRALDEILPASPGRRRRPSSPGPTP